MVVLSWYVHREVSFTVVMTGDFQRVTCYSDPLDWSFYREFKKCDINDRFLFGHWRDEAAGGVRGLSRNQNRGKFHVT